MNCIKLPRWAEELIKCFVGFPERVQYYLDAVEVVEASDVKSSQWIVQLCAPTSDDIATLIENPASVYTHPSFVRLLYRDNTYKDFRDRHVRLVDALEAQSSRLVVEEFLDHLTELSAEDRARSFLLLASEIPSDETGQEEDEERIEWLTRIVASFPTSPRALRPQLLLAASIIGHTPMVTLLLRDIATDDDPAPNIDAVEAECLIEAAVNQHFEIVKELLDGGRFSNGNETRWDAVVQALEVSCSNGAADITDILLPHYLSYCSVISACGVHHPRLHRLALSNWHFEIVEMLLECDPRGTLCNMMELIDTLREEVALSAQEPADTAASSGMLSIIGGEENDDMGDLIMWDAAALARGVSSEDNTLVKFLVNHVGFCPEALEAALATALESGNRELVDIISRPLQKMTDPCDEQDGGEEKEEEEEYERIDSPCPTDLINDEPTEGKTDSGEHGSHDRCQNPTNVDGDNATMALDVLPDVSRPPSAAKLMAARTMSFNEVEQIMSTATQSAVTRKTDDNLLKVTEDKDIDTESTQDDFLSSHFTEVEEVEAAQDNALSHSTEVEADASTKLENDTLTGLQKIDDTSFTAMSVLLRQISSNTVDRVLREGTLVVMQHEVKEHTEASAARQSDAMLTSDGRKYERAITPYEVAAFEIPEGDSFNSKSETTSLTPVGSEEAIALVERERSENQGVIPCESSAGSDTAKIDEAVVNTIVTGDDLAVDDGSLTSSVDTMDVTLEQENCTEVSVHELPVPVLPPPIAIPPSKFLGSTGELKNVDDASVLRRSDSDKDADTERCTSQDHLALPQRSRCRTADTISSEDVTEWKNVDLLLTRKRRLFQTQTGSGESIKVPWGEEFATIQSLKRFAAQYPDVLRAHIATQLRELDGPLSNGSPRKPRSPRSRNPSAHSGAGQARGALLLIKDLAFLLQHRLAPFFDTIVPVVLPTVFSSEKRFLCETATEVLDAIILHCSGRKLALLFLQLGDKYDRHQDLRLYNLTSIYVEKCVRNWSKAEFSSLHASQSSTQLLTLLAKTLMSKSAPVRISAQKTFRHLRDELGRRNFEVVLRAHVSPDLESLVLKECGGGAAPAPSDRKRSRKHHERRVDTQSNSVSNPTIVQGSPSILQRMLLHRQNRVLPAQT
ncbi:hypothetical protein PF006_g7271 [Phytophthora fragariae]|uniref:CLASP N-terminal domain-containing protein n=1 Tax=Phytophthora fragariae TaxID=53985 RepID=A0A6A3KJW2_9STRA|nr:hypothetical protein PF011_g11905 [Phytophthora fragariae]KAE9148107.1 hypothetical protein PF006_g7271 [Phytophthora fragariae]